MTINEPQTESIEKGGHQGEAAAAAEALQEKLDDAMTPGYQAEFDPDEAEQAGAFVEDALSEEDATESDADLVDATVPENNEQSSWSSHSVIYGPTRTGMSAPQTLDQDDREG